MPLPTVTHNGVERSLGLLPWHERHDLPEFADEFDLGKLYGAQPVAPLRMDYGIPIEDQGGTSACGGYSTGGGMELLVAVMTGGQLTRMSRTWLYALVNGGRDQGSSLPDLLQAATRYGCCPVGYFPNSLLYSNQAPQGATQAAACYRLESGYVLRNAGEALAALTMRKPVVLGVIVGTNFGQVDAEGVCPPCRNPRGGHALLADEIYLSPKWGVCLGGPNSWGTSFGVMGRYRVPVSSYLTQGFQGVCLGNVAYEPTVEG